MHKQYRSLMWLVIPFGLKNTQPLLYFHEPNPRFLLGSVSGGKSGRYCYVQQLDGGICVALEETNFGYSKRTIFYESGKVHLRKIITTYILDHHSLKYRCGTVATIMFRFLFNIKVCVIFVLLVLSNISECDIYKSINNGRDL